MRPLADRLRGFRRLVIVPDAQLHHVPFHALHDGRRFLVEEFEISYAPSATILAHCLDRSRPATERSLLMAFSDAGRLPQTVHEVQAAARQLAHPALYLDADARKAVLASAADPLAVLHVATHGAVCYDNPLFSSLAFADGELAVWEVYDARLPAALAVLSACVTGRAIAKGTDLVGLTSAFLCAGAGALLTTLWEIHDESTPVFMGRLYDHLRRGENCAAALRQAQLDLLRAGPYRHPYYWAPFALSGDYGISL
jgi:CHAT domain-containing protein